MAKRFSKAYNRNEPGNAWDYYSAAMEKSKNIKSTRMWDRYLDGSTVITQEILFRKMRKYNIKR